MARYVFILLVAAAIALIPAASRENTRRSAAASRYTSVPFNELPMSFEENRGQFDDEFQFSTRGHGYSVLLNATIAVLKFQDGPGAAEATHALAIKLVGANPKASGYGLDVMPGEANYFMGTKKYWITGVSRHGRIQYLEIYPGVDVTYYGNQGRLEYDLMVHPGAGTENIRLKFEGASAASHDVNGDLVLTVNGRELRQPRPAVFQDIGGKRILVDADYALGSDNTVGFSIGAYDHSKPLVIDPLLSYSIYLGDLNYVHGSAVDSSGNMYVCGETVDPWSDSSRNAFVAKINPEGTSQLYYASFGGDQVDVALAVAVDASGNAYVTGYTAVGVTGHPAFRQFPVMNPLQPERADAGYEAFVTKFDSSGRIVYSTTLGGTGNDRATAIAIDASGDTYIAGETFSPDFPLWHSLQSSLSGDVDAFLTVLNPKGSGFVFSTYIGGSDYDRAAAIAVDSGGNAYITGQTQSPDFPVANAARPLPGGGTCRNFGTSRPCKDAFVLKVDPRESALQYSTYLGGTDDDQGNGIAVDSQGSAWIVGSTASPDFPTLAAVQERLRGLSDAFITRMSSNGSALLYSTYVGGTGSEQGNAIAIDVSGNVYITGSTASTDFPLTRSLQASAGSSDAFVSKLAGNGSTVVYSTLLGGSSSPTGNVAGNAGLGITVDSHADVYVAGVTGAANFPVTANPTRTRFIAGPRNWSMLSGGIETFIAKLTDDGAPSGTGTMGNAPWTRFEQSSSSVVYTGNWYTNPSNIHSGGSSVLAIDSNARAVFTFRGTAARWIAYRYSWSGIARVYIDGVIQQFVDSYTPGSEPQAVVYTTPPLSAETHTLTVEVTATHGPSAQSDWVWIDAFDAIVTPTP